jgi:tetratricopeptide (TPR) repeat protein
VKERIGILLWACLLGSVASAEYEELVVLKVSSGQMLGQYAGRLAAVDPKFQGVVRFGETLQTVNDPMGVDVAALTYRSKHYWRALLEMRPADPAILFAHAHLHAARGEVDYADVYFMLGSLVVDKRPRADLNKYERQRRRLMRRVEKDIKRGTRLHDRGRYTEALAAYDRVLEAHPHCAWAFYEKGYAYLMMGKDEADLAVKRTQMYAACRRCDPFYWQAYQGSDQKVLDKLTVLGTKVVPFVSGKQRTKEALVAFAEGCEAIELYPFAAHARWILTRADPEHMQQHLKAFVRLIEKCGCEDAEFFRNQFQFDEDARAPTVDEGYTNGDSWLCRDCFREYLDGRQEREA